MENETDELVGNYRLHARLMFAPMGICVFIATLAVTYSNEYEGDITVNHLLLYHYINDYEWLSTTNRNIEVVLVM